jgi:hypothetical protein
MRAPAEVKRAVGRRGVVWILGETGARFTTDSKRWLPATGPGWTGAR